MKIEKLTSDQLSSIPKIRDFWADYIFGCKNSLNRNKADIAIDWLYEFCKLNKPIKIYVDSPLGCQYANLYIKELVKLGLLKISIAQVRDQVGAQVWDQVGAQVWDQVGAQVRDQVGEQVWDQVRDQVGEQVWDQVREQVWDQVGAQVWEQVWDQVREQVREQVWDQVGDQVREQVWEQVREQVWDQVGHQVWDQVWDQVGDQVWDQVRDQVGAQVRDQDESFSLYGNISDYGWISFYDFFTQIGVINNDKFNSFKEILLSGIYDMIQLNGFCIVSNMPDKINRDLQNRLHHETSSAIHFRDGYEQFYWHGVSVPDKWILHKEQITKQDIINEKNAEKRRCLKEIIGNEKFIELLEVEIIDEDTDNYGFPVKLFRSKEKDDLLTDYWYFYFGVCPSTKREYYISVPPTDNVWRAKGSTFSNKPIKYRHGDIGLEQVGKIFNQPIMES
jgi:hypothetical protein